MGNFKDTLAVGDKVRIRMAKENTIDCNEYHWVICDVAAVREDDISVIVPNGVFSKYYMAENDRRMRVRKINAWKV